MAGYLKRDFKTKFIWLGGMCFYCLKELMWEEVTPDHRVPRCRGGSDHLDNIVPACFPCNRLKGDKTEEEFRATSLAFSKAPLTFTGLYKICGSTSSVAALLLGGVNDPHLIEKLRKESEGESWAWANPFPT